MNEQRILNKSSLAVVAAVPYSKSSPLHIQLKSTDKNKSSNLSHVPCKFFKQGTCTAGANCIFSHNPDPNSESSVCKYFRKGNCKFGTRCALLHTMSPYSTTNIESTTTTTTSKSQLFDPSPFSARLLDESIFTTNHSYQQDFMLPSSLNDLLTPNELRQQHTNTRFY